MSSYSTFTSTRTTEPDPGSLLTSLRALDATAGLQHEAGTQTYIVKKATAWTTPHITAAQNAIDAAPATTIRLIAQNAVDQMSVYEKAIVLTILDQFNTVRAALSPPLSTITVNQMIAAIRTKAGTL
jgi:hypothetical protein